MDNVFGYFLAIVALLAFGYFLYTKVIAKKSSGSGTGGTTKPAPKPKPK